MKPQPKAASEANNAPPTVSPKTKLGGMVRLLRRTKGATLDDLEKVTGWQRHSVRGAISGSLRGKHDLDINVASEPNRGRVYRIKSPAKAGGAK